MDIMVFRKATVDESAKLAKGRLISLCEKGDVRHEHEVAELYQSNKKYFSEKIGSNEMSTWIAVLDEQVVGAVSILYTRLPPTLSPYASTAAYVCDMFVLPSYLNQGVEKKLLDYATKEASNRCKRITIDACYTKGAEEF